MDLLDVNSTVKFNLSETDVPIFTAVIPALMDLDEAQDLDETTTSPHYHSTNAIR